MPHSTNRDLFLARLASPPTDTPSAEIPAAETQWDLEAELQRHFGYTSFRPGQRKVLEYLLSGQSAAAVFPTGSGKSLCYQLPAVLLPGLTLVVSPLIALMKDQIDALSARQIPAARLDSSLSPAEVRATWSAIRSGKLKLLYVAAERFSNERFRELIKESRLSLFAVDEAHCISEWGHNFRPDYLKLASFAQLCRAERILALTATATPPVLTDICREFNIATKCAVRTGFYRPNLSLEFLPVTAEERDQHLVQQISSQPPGATIVYVTQQKTTDQVVELLTEAGVASQAYHAGMNTEDRTRVQEWFLQNPHSVIVATIAFGMGIDKADIRYVYHYNLPKSLENYSQEVGRAGRDGLPAFCSLLGCAKDLRILENFIYGDTPSYHSVLGLLTTIFRQGSQLRLNISQLSLEHDIRGLVVRTLLTYLELDQMLVGGTPCYNQYKLQFVRGAPEIVRGFQGERRQFLERVFQQARKAQSWHHLDVDQAASQIGCDRERIIRALEYLNQQNMLRVEAAGLLHRYEVRQQPLDLTRLADDLYQRMVLREQRELQRLKQVMELIRHNGCQTNFLAAHFDESDLPPCGHCTWCRSAGQVVHIPERTPAAIPPMLWREVQMLQREHAPSLHDARATTRFLCGIASPRLTRAKLHRNPWFGRLEDIPFQRVLSELEKRES